MMHVETMDMTKMPYICCKRKEKKTINEAQTCYYVKMFFFSKRLKAFSSSDMFLTVVGINETIYILGGSR